MRQPTKLITSSAGGLALLIALATLAVMLGAQLFAPPMCTGPAVVRCDYIAVAKAEAISKGREEFDPAYGIDVFDIGSSVRVQQHHSYEGLVETTAVVIDKRSCRPCAVEAYYPPDTIGRGRLVSRSPPTDLVAAEANGRRMDALGIGRWPEP